MSDEVLPDFFGTIKASADIAALVGTNPARIYPDILDEGCSMPAIRYFVVSQVEGQILDDGGSDGLKQTRLQVDCYDLTRTGANALAVKVRTLFDGFQGLMGQAYVNTIKRDNVIDTYEPDRKQYCRTLDFIVSYN